MEGTGCQARWRSNHHGRALREAATLRPLAGSRRVHERTFEVATVFALTPCTIPRLPRPVRRTRIASRRFDPVPPEIRGCGHIFNGERQCFSSTVEKRPAIDPSARIAPNATICGEVSIAANTSIGFGAVVSAESGAVSIGANCVVMDTAVLRGVRGNPLTIVRRQDFGRISDRDPQPFVPKVT